MDTPQQEQGQGQGRGGKDQETVKAMIMQLSELTDLIGLRTYIVDKTNYGKRPGKDAWTYTRAAMSAYASAANTERVIALFAAAGCHNEIEAVRWLLRHDQLVP